MSAVGDSQSGLRRAISDVTSARRELHRAGHLNHCYILLSLATVSA